jgi:hypothetical protein
MARRNPIAGAGLIRLDQSCLSLTSINTNPLYPVKEVTMRWQGFTRSAAVAAQ